VSTPEPYNLDEELENADWMKSKEDLVASLPEGTDVEQYMKDNGLDNLPIAKSKK